jgi:2-oxoglutarate ferredoxin oxidoreductase subunit gamma
MNMDSLPLCEEIVKSGGIMVVNSTLVKEEPKRKDFKVVCVEASGLAEKIGHIRYANMVALGAVAKVTGALKLSDSDAILRKFFPPDKHKFVPENVKAIQAGFEAV